MDNDLPPSYNSVVKNQLRKRNQTGNERELSEDETGLEKRDKRQEISRTGSIDDSPKSDLHDKPIEQSGQIDSRPTLWGRVKKALEDLALFVIQVLD